MRGASCLTALTGVSPPCGRGPSGFGWPSFLTAFSIASFTLQAQAFDHGQSQNRAAKPARTKFRSVHRMAVVGCGD